jgi:hypothetical protein
MIGSDFTSERLNSLVQFFVAPLTILDLASLTEIVSAFLSLGMLLSEDLQGIELFCNWPNELEALACKAVISMDMRSICECYLIDEFS